jgi:hypothetical protein
MKKILIVLGVLLVLAVPLAAFAVTSDFRANRVIRYFWKFDPDMLTNEQKNTLSNEWLKVMNLKKEIIKQLEAKGSLTPEQGAVAIDRINDMIEYGYSSEWDDSRYNHGGWGSWGGYGRGGWSGCPMGGHWGY